MTTKQDLLDLRNEINELLNELDRLNETVPGDEFTVEHPTVPDKTVTLQFDNSDLNDVRQNVETLRQPIKQKVDGQDLTVVEARSDVGGDIGGGGGGGP